MEEAESYEQLLQHKAVNGELLQHSMLSSKDHSRDCVLDECTSSTIGDLLDRDEASCSEGSRTFNEVQPSLLAELSRYSDGDGAEANVEAQWKAKVDGTQPP
jgi:hypothetical protein